MGYHTKIKIAELEKKKEGYCNGVKGIPTRIKKSMGDNYTSVTELFSRKNSINIYKNCYLR